jgi:hypothetical protein
MNKETKDIIVAYIKESLNPVYGVSKEAHNLLEQLLKTDRDFAYDLHDTFNNISVSNKTYATIPDIKDFADVNEAYLERVSGKATHHE